VSPFLDLWSWWPQTALVIDRAETADAEDLATIHGGAFHRGWPADDFVAMLGENAVLAHVIRRRAGAPVAGFVLSRLAADEAEILTVAVDARLRGRGLAGRLLAEHVKDLMRAGIRHLFLEVESENAPALKLYARHGFATIGRRKGYYRSASGAADAITMRRELPPL